MSGGQSYAIEYETTYPGDHAYLRKTVRAVNALDAVTQLFESVPKGTAVDIREMRRIPRD